MRASSARRTVGAFLGVPRRAVPQAVRGARLGPGPLADLVRGQRQSYLSDLGSLTRLRREHAADPLKALLIEALAHTKADLEVVDSAEQRLAPVAAAARPVQTEATAGRADHAV